MRIGHGYDIHRLVADRPLVLGGVIIPAEKGEAGHSDGDALVHAIIDALLGAAALSDIGTHFPPGDPAYRDIKSTELLAKTMKLVKEAGFSVANVDSTVILEQPMLKPHMQVIRSALARTMNLENSRISVKAKTMEGLNSTGRGDSVEAHAVVLLLKESDNQ